MSFLLYKSIIPYPQCEIKKCPQVSFFLWHWFLLYIKWQERECYQGASSFPEPHCQSSEARVHVLLGPSKTTSESRCEGCLAVTSVTVTARTVWNDSAYFDGSGVSSSTTPYSPKKEIHSLLKVYKGYRGLALIFHYCFQTTLWMPAHGLLMACLMQPVLSSGRINGLCNIKGE